MRRSSKLFQDLSILYKALDVDIENEGKDLG